MEDITIENKYSTEITISIDNANADYVLHVYRILNTLAADNPDKFSYKTTFLMNHS